MVESLVALLLVLLVTGAVLGLVNVSVALSSAQPELAEMQQRARVASDILFRDLIRAGAGVYAGPRTGSLASSFAPVVPRKVGLQGDPFNVARADAVSIAYVPATASQTRSLAAVAQDLVVEALPNCPRGQAACGLRAGMTVLLFDDQGHFDFFRVTGLGSAGAQLDPHGAGSSYAYQTGAVVAEAESHTYYFDAAKRQLRHYDGYKTDRPVVDDVVGVQFKYFGDVRPPAAPKPPPGVANCLYDPAGVPTATGGALPAHGGSLVELPLTALNDGPWCGAGANRFDADLLRIRRIAVTVRTQATGDEFRSVGPDFAVSGRNRDALRYLPDFVMHFEVTPRNMGLGG